MSNKKSKKMEAASNVYDPASDQIVIPGVRGLSQERLRELRQRVRRGIYFMMRQDPSGAWKDDVLASSFSRVLQLLGTVEGQREARKVAPGLIVIYWAAETEVPHSSILNNQIYYGLALEDWITAESDVEEHLLALDFLWTDMARKKVLDTCSCP